MLKIEHRLGLGGAFGLERDIVDVEVEAGVLASSGRASTEVVQLQIEVDRIDPGHLRLGLVLAAGRQVEVEIHRSHSRRLTRATDMVQVDVGTGAGKRGAAQTVEVEIHPASLGGGTQAPEIDVGLGARSLAFVQADVEVEALAAGGRGGGREAAAEARIDVGQRADLGRWLERVDLEVQGLVGRCHGGSNGGGRCSRGRGGRRDRFSARLSGLVARVLRLELVAESRGLQPHLALAAGGLLQLTRKRVEGWQILALGVDLQQLEMSFEAPRLALNRLFENLLGLTIAPIGEVDLGFGQRIDLFGDLRLRRSRSRAIAPEVSAPVSANALTSEVFFSAPATSSAPAPPLRPRRIR